MSSSFNNTKRFQDPREIERKKKLTAIGSDLMNSAYDRLIGSQLGKVKGGKVAEKSREEMEQEYKRGLEEGREMAIGGEKKGKGLSEEHLEMARKTGLSGAVIAVMMGEKGGEGEEDSEEKKRKKKDDREKKKKPHKVKKEKRKYKKDKKERSKKKKKARKRRRRRRREGRRSTLLRRQADQVRMTTTSRARRGVLAVLAISSALRKTKMRGRVSRAVAMV